MKTILIITSQKSSHNDDTSARLGYVQEFCDAVEARLDNTHVLFTTYDDLIVTVIDRKVTIFDSRNALDVLGVSFVHFKNWINDAQTAGMVAKSLRRTSIDAFNSEVILNPARTKIAQMVLLAQAGISVPNTFYASRNALQLLFQERKLPVPFVFPLILKANDGAKGNDNYLVRSFEQALSILREAESSLEFVLQTFHENDGDYRFLFIGLEEEPMVFLRKGDSSTHLNNTSQGGTGRLLSLHEVPQAYYDIAKEAAAITGREIGGVDILVDKNSKLPYVLEVNQTPALATGFAVDVKVGKFASFINQFLDEEEE